MGTETDIHYMSLALSLAEKGRGKVSPNPFVGAVVVRDDTVIGQGYHQKAGDDHAEVIALREAGKIARGATMYVNMEPCCHYGKTPPCTDAICESGIRRVVMAGIDENPRVCGLGIGYLRKNHVETSVGVLEDRSRKLNEVYLKYIKTGVPFVTLKLAVTLDGRIADSERKSSWITGPETRKRVHLWRAWSDAVMVGVGTVLADDSMLTVRDVDGSDPLRVIVDSRLQIPLDSNVFADDNVIIATSDTVDKARLNSFEQTGVEVWKLYSENGWVSISALLSKLGEREITSVLCEGGSILATALLKERLIDKVVFTIAPKILGSGIQAIGDIGIKHIQDAIILKEIEIEKIGDDVIVSGYPVYK